MSKPHFLPADFCLTSTTPALFCLTVSGARAFTQGTQTPLPPLLLTVTAACCSGALHLQGDRKGVRMSWSPRLPACRAHGRGNERAPQQQRRLFQTAACAFHTRAAACWPVKPASPAERVVEQETGREAQPYLLPKPSSP